MASQVHCPRCNTAHELNPCRNCGGIYFRTGLLTNGLCGLICNGCDIGFAYAPCVVCRTLIPALRFTNFNYPAPLPR